MVYYYYFYEIYIYIYIYIYISIWAKGCVLMTVCVLSDLT